jgi:GTPase SAR1 family protein
MPDDSGVTIPFPNDEGERGQWLAQAEDLIGQALDLMIGAGDLDLLWSSDPRGAAGSISAVKHDLESVRNKELRMAIVAPMKAGKSTLVNSIVGYEFLPARGSAMTTLPTRIVLDRLATDTELSDADGLAPTLAIADEDARQFERLIESIRTPLAAEARAIEDKRPYLKPVIGLILSGQAVTVPRQVKGRADVQRMLMLLNDLARLAELLHMSRDAFQLSDVPVVRTPYWSPGTLAEAGSGTLVIIDTPGPDEEELTKVLAPVVSTQLRESHVIFVVLDYTKMGTAADAQVRELMRPTIDVIGDMNRYAIVNKIDQRLSRAVELSDDEVKRSVATALGMSEQAADGRVFRVSAEWALRSVIVLGDVRGGRLGAPSASESARQLLQLSRPLDWEEDINDISETEITRIAERGWQRQGHLEEFLEAAIARLRADALPKLVGNTLVKTQHEIDDLVTAVVTRRDLLGRDSAGLAKAAAELAAEMTSVADFRKEVTSPMKLADQTVVSLTKILDGAKRRGEDVVKKLERDLREDSGQGKSFFSRRGDGGLSFSSENDARLFIQAKTAGPVQAIDIQLSSARENAEAAIGKSATQYVKNEEKKVRPVIDRAAARLQVDFNIEFAVPDFTLKLQQQDASFEPERESTTNYRSETRTTTHRRWYTLWMYPHTITETVSVPYESTTYVVKPDAITVELRNSLRRRVDQIQADLSGHVKQVLADTIKRYYDNVEAFLLRYFQILEQSANDNNQSAQEQQELRLRLDKFHAETVAVHSAIRVFLDAS